jgi:hypothetical protein
VHVNTLGRLRAFAHNPPNPTRFPHANRVFPTDQASDEIRGLIIFFNGERGLLPFRR